LEGERYQQRKNSELSYRNHSENSPESMEKVFRQRLHYFDVLLTVHLSIFILVINQLDAQKFVLQ